MKKIRIYSWNVNGIRAVARKGFVEWLGAESPDALCLQETKAHPEQLDDDIRSPEGYHAYWNNPPRKGYAGVSVYTRTEPSSVEDDFPPSDFDTEGRMLKLQIGDFVLLNVYFPNGGMGPERLGYKLDFYEKFLKYIDGIESRNIVICGDFNTAHKPIDLARPKQNEMFSGFLPEERAWLDKLVSHGYVDTFRHFNDEPGQYTWWDYKSRSRERNVGWRIDYFFVTEKFLPRVKDAFILSEVTGSDHCPVGIEIDQK
ncbi:MAG: exodeoxyribonuclease III [Candidatus Omnitrophica bacterium]|nr:exodeoxyribonuclease III [Candidatus Omnitrophota bacterium]